MPAYGNFPRTGRLCQPRLYSDHNGTLRALLVEREKEHRLRGLVDLAATASLIRLHLSSLVQRLLGTIDVEELEIGLSESTICDLAPRADGLPIPIHGALKAV